MHRAGSGAAAPNLHPKVPFHCVKMLIFNVVIARLNFLYAGEKEGLSNHVCKYLQNTVIYIKRVCQRVEDKT